MAEITQKDIHDALEQKFIKVQEELKAAQDRGDATDLEIQKLHDDIERSGNIFEAYVKEQEKNVRQSIQAQLKSFLNENKQKLKDLHKAGSGTITFIPKAVGDITTASGSDVGTPSHLFHTNLGGFNLRNDDDLINLATVSSTGSPTYSYTELLPKDGNFDFVAEGAEKPQIDFKWENRFAEPFKIAAYEILTEEAVTDVERMESVAREYLLKKHNLFKADKVFFGTGNAGEPKGATAYGRQFVAGAMANAVPSPTFMDVVNAAITDVYTTHNYTDESSYQPNLVLVSPVDFFLNLVSAKDFQGRPLYPQAGLFNTVTIGGVTIRPWIKMPAGKIFVADIKLMHIVNYIPFSIRIGWINEQFIHNTFTMLGESRYFQFVKRLDEQAFIYDDIATIKTAIAEVDSI